MNFQLIYLICFGVGLVFAVASALLAHLFGGHDGHLHAHAPHVEHDFGHGGMPGFGHINPTTVAAFVTAFGGFGLVFNTLPVFSDPWFSVPLSALGGFGVAAAVFVVFSKIFRATQCSSEGQVARLFGLCATVITPIAAGGVGEIAYVQGGTRYTAPARTESLEAIASGEQVRIVRVARAECYVVKD